MTDTGDVDFLALLIPPSIFHCGTMMFYRLNKSHLQEACSSLAPNILLFPDTSDRNLLSETATPLL